MAGMKRGRTDNFFLIKKLSKQFGEEYFDDDLSRYADKLLRKVQRTALLDLNRGRPENWAAAVALIICQLNFLFDKENDRFITTRELCDFFAVKLSTIRQKANLIGDACKIHYGNKEYTKPEIREIFEVYITPEGFLVPSSMVVKEKDARGNEIAYLDSEKILRDWEEKGCAIRDSEAKQARERIELLRQRTRERMKKAAEEKRERRNRNQLNLFDDV